MFNNKKKKDKTLSLLLSYPHNCVTHALLSLCYTSSSPPCIDSDLSNHEGCHSNHAWFPCLDYKGQHKRVMLWGDDYHKRLHVRLLIRMKESNTPCLFLYNLSRFTSKSTHSNLIKTNSWLVYKGKRFCGRGVDSLESDSSFDLLGLLCNRLYLL